MKAAVLHGPRDLRVEAAKTPRPGAGEALVRVAMAGLCGTDYRIFSGDRPVSYPRVMGHEFVGRVEAVGSGVTTPRVGDNVAIEPNYSCGACALCREGNRNLCLSRTAVGIDVDGCFAELVSVPARCCWPAPAGVSDEDLIVTEPLAVVVRAVARGVVREGETTAVVGGGTLGLLALQVLRARGARVLVVGRSTRRFALAKELGAEATHALAEGPLEDAAHRFSRREGVDCVIETAGTPEAVSHALALVRPGGRVVLTGLPHEPTSVSFFSVVRREVTITGSMIYQDEFGEAMRLVADGLVRTRPLVTHRFALDEIARAFAVHREPASIKVALVP
ncbi:MAG TPA: alcohol dehydrogenase catalytic domain-containing protein [Methylomirabilota bacterium]|jgi:2-desacetyl-2-hydroxyethyl bacteriochlorophyllide A dehydrogenase|nr:alcohol dehydrogenase catalytic domain-containing protein [Methylomirabilota bacterium]